MVFLLWWAQQRFCKLCTLLDGISSSTAIWLNLFRSIQFHGISHLMVHTAWRAFVPLGWVFKWPMCSFICWRRCASLPRGLSRRNNFSSLEPVDCWREGEQELLHPCSTLRLGKYLICLVMSDNWQNLKQTRPPSCLCFGFCLKGKCNKDPWIISFTQIKKKVE